MRALAVAMTLGLVGCSSTNERTLHLDAGDPDDLAYWLDNTGIDPIVGAGVDQGPARTCQTDKDCPTSLCIHDTVGAPGLCLAACLAPPELRVPIRGCQRGVERCLYIPKSRVGACFRPCASDAQCPPDLACVLLITGRPDLGRVCFPRLSD